MLATSAGLGGDYDIEGGSPAKEITLTVAMKSKPLSPAASTGTLPFPTSGR
jgi:hypothetical protein